MDGGGAVGITGDGGCDKDGSSGDGMRCGGSWGYASGSEGGKVYGSGDHGERSAG